MHQRHVDQDVELSVEELSPAKRMRFYSAEQGCCWCDLAVCKSRSHIAESCALLSIVHFLRTPVSVRFEIVIFRFSFFLLVLVSDGIESFFHKYRLSEVK